MSARSIDDAVRLAVAADAPRLPPADEGAIQRLVMGYGLCADFSLLDELTELFEPEAVWDGSAFRFPRCEGRDEIRAWFGKVAAAEQRQVHVMGPVLVRPVTGDGDIARGIVSFDAMEAAPEGHGVFAAQHAYGLYEDEYVKRGDAWRFSQRVLHLRLVRR